MTLEEKIKEIEKIGWEKDKEVEEYVSFKKYIYRIYLGKDYTRIAFEYNFLSSRDGVVSLEIKELSQIMEIWGDNNET